VENYKTKGFLGELKEFAVRGNAMDVASGVLLGMASFECISFLAGGLVMFLFYDSYYLTRFVKYIPVITLIVRLLLTVLILYLFASFTNRLKQKEKAKMKTDEPSNEETLLMEIRDLLKEQKNG